MKINILETEGCFCLKIESQTAEEVCQLARIGIDATKELRTFAIHFSREGVADLSLVFGKRRKYSATIRK